MDEETVSNSARMPRLGPEGLPEMMAYRLDTGPTVLIGAKAKEARGLTGGGYSRGCIDQQWANR